MDMRAHTTGGSVSSVSIGPPFGSVRYRISWFSEYRTTMWEVAGSNPGRANTQGLKITEEKVLPLSFYPQMIRLSSLLGQGL